MNLDKLITGFVDAITDIQVSLKEEQYGAIIYGDDNVALFNEKTVANNDNNLLCLEGDDAVIYLNPLQVLSIGYNKKDKAPDYQQIDKND